MYVTAVGPVTLLAIYEKVFESDTSDVPGYVGKADADANNYALAGIYGFPGGNAGLLYYYITSAAPRLAFPASRQKLHYIAPYVKAQFGPVYVEGELGWTTGKLAELDETVAGFDDVDNDGWGAYLYAKTNLGPAYFGGQFAWTSGDDGSDATKNKSFLIGSTDWNPALILMNDDFNTWKAGGVNTSNSGKLNMMFFQIFGGFDPTPKINVQAALAFAKVDTIPAAAAVNKNESKDLGYEFDVTATYKLYDNLSYMVGAGYLWTGDAFKGYGAGSANNVVDNDYMLMNKLTLSF
jgi:hypothetical protein